MSAAREIAGRFIRRGVAAVFDALIAEDVVVETGLSPAEPIRGREAYKAVFVAFADAWLVRDFTVNCIDEAGDAIFVEFNAKALFAKHYYGVPATRQIVPMREIRRLDVKGGRIVHNVVAAVNLPSEFIMDPVLKDAALGSLERAPIA